MRPAPLAAGAHAVVTGGSSGIGYAIAGRLLARGCRVTIAARTATTLAASAERLLAAAGPGAAVEAVATDVSVAADRERLLERARSRFGAIDVLVNNAGMQYQAPLETLDFAKLASLMDVNHAAPLHLVQMVLPEMLARGSGRLLAIASVAGKVAYPRGIAYCSSKHALVAAHQSLRNEVGSRGVSVSVVCPGYVENDFAVHHGLEPPRYRRRRFLSMVLTNEEVAEAAMDALDSGRFETTLPLALRAVARLNGVAPNFATWLLSKLYRR